jgi:hypothetical protein
MILNRNSLNMNSVSWDSAKEGVRRPLEEIIMPIVFRHVYERATGWLYDYEPRRFVGADR